MSSTSPSKAPPVPATYAGLPIHADFESIADPRSFAPLPDDWIVAIADLVDSTGAIARGLWKDVNLLGASAIVAVRNAVQPIEIPYVFGGDGATLCLPASAREAASEALRATMQIAERQFGLMLRAALIPIAELRARGVDVRVARYRASESYVQAAFSGGGVQLAERLAKHADLGRAFRLAAPTETVLGDFSGLECRWSDIASPREEIATWLVQALHADEAARARTYAEVLELFRAIYGAPADAHPIALRHLQLSLSGEKLAREAKVHGPADARFARLRRLLAMRAENLLGRVCMRLGLRAAGVVWGSYRQEVRANTDYRKFDDVLREVLAGTRAQREELVARLEPRRRAGELVFGVHASSHALMTCLVFERAGTHVHFVDGRDGGYAMAALALKRQLAHPSA
ncbi:MAG: DUF3095 domain-containing protein [Planctomycetes bacterium]|nr:DUF3095 domain-containing protein [Planctomycetota bacterium]